MPSWLHNRRRDCTPGQGRGEARRRAGDRPTLRNAWTTPCHVHPSPQSSLRLAFEGDWERLEVTARHRQAPNVNGIESLAVRRRRGHLRLELQDLLRVAD